MHQPDGFNYNRPRLRKRTLSIGTWNVQGLNTKEQEVIGEITEMNGDIMVLSETKKKGKGQEKLGNYTHIWSGVPKSSRAKKGVSILIKNKWVKNIVSWEEIDERIIKLNLKLFGIELIIIGVYAINEDTPVTEKNEFFDKLSETLGKIKKHQEVIITGDFNSRVGSRMNDEVIGPFGEKVENDNGDRLITLCKQHGYMIMNSFFQHREIHKFTWEQPTKKQKSIIDYIIVKQKRDMIVKDVRVYRKPECGSDHYMLLGKFILTSRKKQNTMAVKEDTINTTHMNEPKYKVNLLYDESIKHLFQARLKQKLNLNLKNTASEMYHHLKESIHSAALEALGTEDLNYKKKQ